MFGKNLGEYLRFQKPVLIALVVVGLARLVLSAAGLPNSTVRWLVMNVVLWGGAIYYGVAVYTRRFGSYRQLLPLIGSQVLVFQAIAALGILLVIAGIPNIFGAPEYSFQAGNQWVHLVAHLTVGVVVPVLLLWGAASLAMLVTKRLRPRPGVAVGQQI